MVYDGNMKTTGQRLMAVRGNTSQTDFARQLRTSRQSLWKWEQDKCPIPVAKARLLGVSLDWLYLGKGNP